MGDKQNVIVIGSGPAGLTAAIYLGRGSFHPIVIDGPEPGGQLTTTSEVGNYPGFPEDIPGPELMQKMRQQAERFEVAFVAEAVTAVDFSQRPFTVTMDKRQLSGDSVIIATGASAKWLGLDNEQRLRGKGVSACATCDGFFFKGKDIAVVGGGDTAMEEATYLTKFAKKVYVLVRSDEQGMKSSQIMKQEAKDNEKIDFIFNTEVTEVLGEQAVSGIRIINNQTHEERELEVQGLFVAIGHKPNTDFLGDTVDTDKGYIKVTDNTKTSVSGVFAAGDVHDYRYRQAITAAGLGCMAALDAMAYMRGGHREIGTNW